MGGQNADILAACTDSGAAAHLCATLSINGVSGWFLPSRDELTAMHHARSATGAVSVGDAGGADNFSYWASSQQTADMAGHVDFADVGGVHFDDKDFRRRVRAVRQF